MKKKFNLGKSVKKWLQQKKDIAFIAELLDTPVSDCINAYHDYMGWGRTLTEKSGKDLMTLILQKKKVHIYGGAGCGKTFSVDVIAKELDLITNISYARNDEDLVADWTDVPFTDDDQLFVMEGDNFYWKAYGTIKHYITNSIAPIILITTYPGTPTKNITKLLTQLKIYPPTRSEMEQYILELDPLWEGNINKIYDRDQRITWRNYLYNKRDKTPPYSETIDSKKMAYKILVGKATIEDFKKNIHPWIWTIDWLGYNATNFYYGTKLKNVLQRLAFVDAHRFSYKKIYLQQILLDLPKAQRKGHLGFPPYKRVKEEVMKEEPLYKISKYKIKKRTKKTAKFAETSIDDFMLI